MTRAGFFMSAIAVKHSCLTNKCQKNRWIAQIDGYLKGRCWPILLKNSFVRWAILQLGFRCEVCVPANTGFWFLFVFLFVYFMFFGRFQTISGATGGPVSRYLAIRLRFCTVAVSKNSSRAPLRPRSRSRSIESTPRKRLFDWCKFQQNWSLTDVQNICK